MTRIGGWWLASHPLEGDEEVIEKYPVNYFFGSDRPLGGRLYVTDRRVIFLPHFIDSFFGATPTVIDLFEIVDVTEEERDSRGGHAETMPARLEIETDGATVHRFVIKDTNAAIETILAAIEELTIATRHDRSECA